MISRFATRLVKFAPKTLSFKLQTMSSSQYVAIERGTANTESYRVYFANASDQSPVSPFHDIPYLADAAKKTFNMVVEIPRWSNAKMEIATKEALNPIKQDIKKGVLRNVKNVFPHHGYIWNYGAIPQTWENPAKKDAETGFNGDNDPIDACEIGSRVHKRGAVISVKVLGCYALIDEGETDWKIIVIDTADPLSAQLNDLKDVERLMPGLLRATYEWFKVYKVPDGKPENQFAFNGEPKNRDFALKIIEETHQQWVELINGPSENAGGLHLGNVTQETNNATNFSEIFNKTAPFNQGTPLSNEQQRTVDKSYFITSK